MTEDYEKPLSSRMFVDAMAAISVSKRIGFGKLRNLETQCIWLQEAVRDKRVGLSKVHGPVIPEDLMTKHVGHVTHVMPLSLMSVEACIGRRRQPPRKQELVPSKCVRWSRLSVTTISRST